QITDIDQCLTLAQPLSDLVQPLRQLLAGTQLVHSLGHVELIEFVQQPVVLLRLAQPLTVADSALLQAFAKQYQVAIWLAYDSALVPLSSDQQLPRYATLDATLTCQPNDFIQSHRQLSQTMVAQAIAWLEA